MQGLWKDKRKNFLKDKKVFLNKRFRKDLSPEKSLKLFGVEDLNPSCWEETSSFEETIEKKVSPMLIKGFYNHFLNFEDLKKCDNCPFRESEEKRCSTYDRLISIKNNKLDKTWFAKNSSFFCKKDEYYFAAYYYVKEMIVYIDPRDRTYREFFSNKIIDTNFYHLDFSNSKELKDYSFSIKITEKYVNMIYNPSLDISIDFVYGKPEETYKRSSYGRRKYCSCFSNRLNRRKRKEYEKNIKEDIEFYYHKNAKNHLYEKSVAWCVS